jgi:hypothetical protein
MKEIFSCWNNLFHEALSEDVVGSCLAEWLKGVMYGSDLGQEVMQGIFHHVVDSGQRMTIKDAVLVLVKLSQLAKKYPKKMRIYDWLKTTVHQVPCIGVEERDRILNTMLDTIEHMNIGDVANNASIEIEEQLRKLRRITTSGFLSGRF